MADSTAFFRSRFFRYFALLAALFIAVRLLFLRQILDSPLLTLPILDSQFYHTWAASLASGYGHPPGPFWLSPLYPLFMGGVFKAFGSYSITLIVVIQFILSLGTLSLVVAYTRRLWGDGAALVTAGLAALYAPWLFYDSVLLSASLILFLDASLLYLLVTRTDFAVSDNEPPTVKSDGIWLLLGLLTGLSALARPSVLIFAVVLIAGHVLQRRQGWWRRALLYVAAIVVLLLPVMIRNYQKAGSFTLTTSSGGVNFFIGNRAGASGIYDELDFVNSFDPQREAEGYRAEASKRTGKEMSLAQASRYWRNQALDDIFHSPGGWLRLEFKKLWLAVQREEIPTNMSFRGAAGFAPVLHALPIRWGLLFPLAAAGAFLAWRRRRDVRLLWFYAASYLAVNLIFFTSSEYRFPLILVLLPAAGCFFAELWKKIADRDVKILLKAALIYIIALIVCNVPSVSVAHAVRPSAVYYNMAVGAEERGMLIDAVPLYARSLAADPDYREARLGMANILWKLGNFDDARREFELAGETPPDPVSGAPLESFLDELYLQTEEGDYPAALALLDSVFPAHQDAPRDVWANRAMVEVGMHKFSDAMRSVLNAEKKEPDSPEWPYKAGEISLLMHDTLQADSFLAESLKRYPAYAPARLALGELALSRQDTAAAWEQFEELKRIRIPDEASRTRLRNFALKLTGRWDAAP
ncbi:tetratricopeptide repeat protein [candidate division KSB1 bacterium]|nr:MAG: tetratricopeptide repeat protein [candidate division KSB1 bacterium]